MATAGWTGLPQQSSRRVFSTATVAPVAAFRRYGAGGVSSNKGVARFFYCDDRKRC